MTVIQSTLAVVFTGIGLCFGVPVTSHTIHRLIALKVRAHNVITEIITKVAFLLVLLCILVSETEELHSLSSAFDRKRWYMNPFIYYGCAKLGLYVLWFTRIWATFKDFKFKWYFKFLFRCGALVTVSCLSAYVALHSLHHFTLARLFLVLFYAGKCITEEHAFLFVSHIIARMC